MRNRIILPLELVTNFAGGHEAQLNRIEHGISNPLIAGSIFAAPTTTANPSRSVLPERNRRPNGVGGTCTAQSTGIQSY